MTDRLAAATAEFVAAMQEALGKDPYAIAKIRFDVETILTDGLDRYRSAQRATPTFPPKPSQMTDAAEIDAEVATLDAVLDALDPAAPDYHAIGQQIHGRLRAAVAALKALEREHGDEGYVDTVTRLHDLTTKVLKVVFGFDADYHATEGQ